MAMDLGQPAAAMCKIFGQAHASEKFFLCFPATFTVVALRFSPPRTLLIQHLAAWPDPILSL